MKDDCIKIANECLGKQEVWEEEFEDTILLSEINTSEGIKGVIAFPTEKLWTLSLFNLSDVKSIKHLFDKYFTLEGMDRNLEASVKIKARKGAILIEAVKK